MKSKEKYDDFDEWETDVFRAGATQVLEVGENIFYAIRTPNNKPVQSDADGMFDLRSRRGREVMKTAKTIGGWAGGSGEIYRHIVARAGKARPYENPAHRPKETPLYVKYLSLMSGEVPFMMQGTKYEYVWAEYPGGIKDIGVYSYAGDLVYSYDSFRKMMNLDQPNLLREMMNRPNPAHRRNMGEGSMPKRRIGISLSKNRKRNPLESGATISDDDDINNQASNMG